MKVKIINFMCHKQIELEFSNFQVLFAENGSGKSAIFHAINWLIEGGTNNHITKGYKKCSVMLELDNKKIERIVEGSKNSVYLNNELICTTKDSLDKLGIDIKLSFVNQFDKLFLLSETPKIRAEILNDMFDIEKLEVASSICKNNIKENEKQLKEHSLKLEELDIQRDKLKSNLNYIKTLEDKYDKSLYIFNKIKEVYNLNKLIKVIPEKINKNIELKLIKKLYKIKELCYTINKLPNKISLTIDYTKLDKLDKIVKLIKELENGNKLLKVNIDELKQLETKLKGRCCPLCQKMI